MGNDSSTTIQVGPGGTMALTIIFVLLKVFGYIDWSWWWVFAPLWIGALLVVLILTIILIIAIVASMVQNP